MSETAQKTKIILPSKTLRLQARNLLAQSRLLRKLSTVLRNENAAITARSNQLAIRICEMDEQLLASYRVR